MPQLCGEYVEIDTITERRKMMLVQQGDVLFQAVKDSSIRGANQQPRTQRIVVAEGEATGHAHAIVDVDESVDVYRIGDVTFLYVRETVEVIHEEHETVTLQPAVWRVSQVREYDHFAEESRRVMD